MTIEHPYLTDSEMREICAPLTRSCAIRRWFQRNGFVTKTKPNGMPLVSRAHYNEVGRTHHAHRNTSKPHHHARY